MKISINKNILKKYFIFFSLSIFFLWIIYAIGLLIFLPLEVKSWFDYKPRPPYLPFEDSFYIKNALYEKDIYFIPSEVEFKIRVTIRHYCKTQKSCKELKEIVYKHDSVYNTIFLIKLIEQVDKKEITLYSQIVKDKEVVCRKDMFSFDAVVFPVKLKKSGKYKIRIVNILAAPEIERLADTRVLISHYIVK